MKTLDWAVPALLALAAAAPPRAAAWSANGHRAIAQLAEDRLAPGTLQRIQGLWGSPIHLADIAPCADEIRHGSSGVTCAGLQLAAEPESQPWHFVDIPISDHPSSPDKYCSGGNCVVGQIKADVQTLQDPAAAVSSKQIALMFLVHFVGDLHQPLHCANEIDPTTHVNDRGGNLKPVKIPGVSTRFPLDLHSLWDHQLQPEDSNDPGGVAARLGGDIGGDAGAWTSGDFVTAAALESFFTAQKVIYPAFHAPDGATITPAYQEQMQPIVDDRMKRAGVRLAALLERSFPAVKGVPVQATAGNIELPPTHP